MSSEDQLSSRKKAFGSQDNFMKRSGFSRMLSLKSPELALSPIGIDVDVEWQSDEDGVPDEGNKILGLIEGLQNLCFIKKPGFEHYDTGDSEEFSSHISAFPVFKTVFINADHELRPMLK